jgi:hypothetical protein
LGKNSLEKVFHGKKFLEKKFIRKTFLGKNFQNYIVLSRYGTKIKNCSGFMKVDQILKAWSFLSPKILISSK